MTILKDYQHKRLPASFWCFFSKSLISIEYFLNNCCICMDVMLAIDISCFIIFLRKLCLDLFNWDNFLTYSKQILPLALDRNLIVPFYFLIYKFFCCSQIFLQFILKKIQEDLYKIHPLVCLVILRIKSMKEF